jgi:hypothetical protein
VSEPTPGQRFARAFRQATAKRPKLREAELVRHLLASTTAMAEAEGVRVETHRGQRAYVGYEPREGLGDEARRCELADLLVLAYGPGPELRVTFLQARRRPGPLPRVDGPVPLARSQANVYHWDLLHRRPEIEPVGRVRPPRTVLSGARSPSIASFGFFHRPEPERWSLHYAAAQAVRPWEGWPPAARARRTVLFPDATVTRPREGRAETWAAAGLADVGDRLASRRLGTPIELPPAGEHDRLTSSWLASVLAAIARSPDTGEAELATDLHGRLVDELAGAGLVDFDSRVGSPHVAIVQRRRQPGDS